MHSEYLGWRRTTVGIFDAPSNLLDGNLAANLLSSGDIVSTTHDSMRREWKFDLMIDVKTFYSLPNWLPVIVTGRKPACWHCGETSHLSVICPGKKTPLKAPDRSLPPAVKTPISVPVGFKPVPPPPLRWLQKSKEKWLTIVKTGRKVQPADTQSPKVSLVGTDSSEPLTPISRKLPSPKQHHEKKIRLQNLPN